MQYYATVVTTHKPNPKETEMETIKAPDFTRLIAEIQNRACCVNDVDAEVLAEILQKAYDAGYDAGYDALDNTRIIAYDEVNYDGYDDGYDAGYNAGYADGSSESP